MFIMIRVRLLYVRLLKKVLSPCSNSPQSSPSPDVFASTVPYRMPCYTTNAAHAELNTQLASTSRSIIKSALIPAASSTTREKNCKHFCDYYNSLLVPNEKVEFLKILASEYHIDHITVLELAQSLQCSQEKGEASLLRREDKLRKSLQPQYGHIFAEIGHMENGVKFLVDMRADVLNIFSDSDSDKRNPALRDLNTYLRELLTIWFSVGLLQLERVTWESPCNMLQKISEYEAVHPIRNWTDLKRRVGPYRRCYLFTHNSMPREPVVVLHTALTNHISSSIQSIVQNEQIQSEDSLMKKINNEIIEDPSAINTAMFYSITSTQKGLQGVELGNYLIKRVVKEVFREFPHIQQFSSLSPIPGFKEWLLGEINKALHKLEGGGLYEQDLFTMSEIQNISTTLNITGDSVIDVIKNLLVNNSWIQHEYLVPVLQVPMMRLCARYLHVEKRRGIALNPVAHFHLRNGAVMWRLNWLGDLTPRGLGASCGMMVNYRYYLDKTECYSQNYMENQEVQASSQILDFVKQLPKLNETKSHL